MKILVSVKRVTDPDMKVKIKPDGSNIDLEGMKFVVNYFDEIAIEEGLRLKKKHKGEVVLVSIGPKEAEQQIRSGLAMGADRGIRVEATDEELDALSAAAILAKVFEQEKPDVFLMGKQATDGDSNQVGQMLAEQLGLPQATFASQVDVDGDKAKVVREVDGGLETVEVTLPAVITADLRLNEPRYATIPGIMKAKRKKIALLKPADLGVTPKPVVRVLGLEAPPTREAGVIVSSVEELMDKLKNEAKVL